ncbi:MAG: PspC domain-containing protein [Candidatus Cloacimonadales bacterium]
MKKLHKSQREKIIAGVCGGVAESLGVSPSFVRAAFILSLLFGGAGFWLYLILWAILPVANEKIIDAEIIEDEDFDNEEDAGQKVWRSRSDSIIAGVCGGLSEYLKWDVSLIRLAFVAMSFAGGIGFVLYLIFWLIFPLED